MDSETLGRIAVVLSRPSHPGNIGAAARAMKTMGFSDMMLVAPRHVPDPDATAMAAGAADLLEGARIYTTLDAALADRVLVVGFSARGRDLSHETLTLREAAPAIVEAAARGPVALVFGNETSGLSNDELSRCQRLVSVPANPGYSSLNLAAAVQVACYELATCAGRLEAPTAKAGEPATREDVEGLFAQLESTAVASGFLDLANPGRFMERMRRLFARGGLEREEVKLLRGLMNACGERKPKK